MGLQDICLKLAKRVRVDVLSEELREENHLFQPITTMVSQEVSAWAKTHLNLTSTRRILTTSNSRLKSIMRTTNLHLKSEIHQKLSLV